MAGKYKKALIYFAFFLTACFFVIDLHLPLGIAGGIPYVGVVLLTLWIDDRKFPKIFGILGITLTILVYVISKNDVNPLMVFTNRMLAVGGIAVAVYVIQEYKKYENLSKKSRENLDALFTQAREGIIVCNKQGHIRMINPETEQIFGYSRKELLGNSIEKIIAYRSISKLTRLLALYNNSPSNKGIKNELEAYAIRNGGQEFPAEINFSHYYSNSGDGLMNVFFIRDITERKENQELLKKTKDDLEKRVEQRTQELAHTVQKLEFAREEMQKALEKEKASNEMKSRFVTLASHEFRTPLSTILSSVNLLEKYNLPEHQSKREKHIGRIKNAIGNLTQILNDFLSLRKLEDGDESPHTSTFNVEQLIKEVSDEMRVLAKPGQVIRYTGSGTNDSFTSDKLLLRNILINLLSNAIKYSNEGQPITIMSNYNEDTLTIKIKDKGIGISEEDKKHIFQEFFRADGVTSIPGTGLGLNIVKKHIDTLQGQIIFESKVNEGTEFTLTLPKLQEPASVLQSQYV